MLIQMTTPDDLRRYSLVAAYDSAKIANRRPPQGARREERLAWGNHLVLRAHSLPRPPETTLLFYEMLDLETFHLDPRALDGAGVWYQRVEGGWAYDDAQHGLPGQRLVEVVLACGVSLRVEHRVGGLATGETELTVSLSNRRRQEWAADVMHDGFGGSA